MIERQLIGYALVRQDGTLMVWKDLLTKSGWNFTTPRSLPFCFAPAEKGFAETLIANGTLRHEFGELTLKALYIESLPNQKD